jgi:hypothetical protein
MTKLALACIPAVLFFAACSSSNPGASQSGAKAAAKQGEYETGHVSLQKMYLSAREWAADATPIRLQSRFTGDAPVAEGKAGVWRASFASPARNMMKTFVWSGLVGPDAPEQGISFSAEDSWSPSNSSERIFNIAFLKFDSDKAYDVAQKHGGEKLTAKDPKQPVFFVLDWDAAKNELIWHVIYGSSENEAKLRVAVNATSGEFLRIEK